MTTLSENQRCRIKIDATKEVAHITFYEPSNTLGVMYPGYVLGNPIKVDKGKVKYITVYNAK